MSHYFFDSSALVKRYIHETGTMWVRSIAMPQSGSTILIAHITLAEVVSALMRRSRDGSISPRTARAVRLIMERHAQRDYMVIGLTDPIVKCAEDLLEKHPFRAYDSIQLASAIEANHRFLAAGLPAMIFVTADSRLLTVATAEGLQTDDPNKHP
jgi:predicted nucleic acid-binding protein